MITKYSKRNISYTSNRNMRVKSGAGLTLIEIIMVMTLVTTMATLTLATSMDSFRGYSYRNERDTVVNSLQRARSQAISNMCLGVCTTGMPHGVHFSAGNYTIFQGADFASRNIIADEVVQTNPAISITGPTDVTFAELSGDVTTLPVGSFDIVVKDTTGHTSTVTLNSEGQIKWTN